MGRNKDKEKMVPFQLKTPKGTKDWSGVDMVIRNNIFKSITTVFERHGADAFDTPVFELSEILNEKYGEDSKLIYNLQDQGGELCSLRYDLTVPFARWLAENPSIQNVKRYHIGKVYRRDQPAVTKGRMREFYQCDIDIAGSYGPMIPDAEIIRIVCEVFKSLGWGENSYTIKVNHRGILDGIFEICGVPQEKIRTISSAVDKLDKFEWDEVKKEMVEEKGLEEAIADRIWEFVQRKGGIEILDTLTANEELKSNQNMARGVADMGLLFKYLKCLRVLDKVEFNLSLARGLDYYTGLIYEVVTEGSSPATATGQQLQRTAKKEKGNDWDEDRSDDPSVGVGSIAAGGRYDNLVGMFSKKGQIPCVGISFGVDRIFSIIKARRLADKNASTLRSNELDVFVMAFGGSGFTGMLEERMETAANLWDAGIKADFDPKVKSKFQAQFKSAETKGIPFAVILGEDEQKQGKVKIKELGLPKDDPEKDGVMVNTTDLIEEIRWRLRKKAETDAMISSMNGLDTQESSEPLK
ncbi:MAG: hypothetical protein LQ342_002596 [Letrouitia transgressa]|nr:MAG: hypothetical protein LQ342_002596 [Letrouitia transgressa]